MSKGFIFVFKGSHEYLSNFSPHPIKVKGLRYATVEHYFQASKMVNDDDREDVRLALTPALAKKLGCSRPCREDWEHVKHSIMLKGLRKKFKPHSELASKLISTGDRILIEGNHWGDAHWGQVMAYRSGKYEFGEGQGLNMLGVLLMLVRQELGGGF
jgi:ribA/ribD-fused uncharacterized protein